MFIFIWWTPTAVTLLGHLCEFEGQCFSFIHWKTLHNWLVWYFVIECKSDLLGSLYMNYWTNNWSIIQCLLYDLINYSEILFQNSFFKTHSPRFPTIHMEQTIWNQILTNRVFEIMSSSTSHSLLVYPFIRKCVLTSDKIPYV